jgi:G:T-mismatch repair DNA endonuclease (very short patch repair protein)
MKTKCICGCGANLRRDNKSGYKNGHKPCKVCGILIGNTTECCSKSCSAKLHWIRNPEMKTNRVWNEERLRTRNENRGEWINKLSNSRKGKIPWNKGLIGSQIPWNKGLPSENQPFYGKKHSSDYQSKTQSTVMNKYGVKCALELSKHSSRSKKEKQLENLLLGYKSGIRIGRYKPDYVNEDSKNIIEVYGDYWHCNPKFYEASYFHVQLKKTAKEKWMLDKKRVLELESTGYTVTIIWENELPNFIKLLDKHAAVEDYLKKH